jgi:hypothetical protein
MHHVAVFLKEDEYENCFFHTIVDGGISAPARGPGL